MDISGVIESVAGSLESVYEEGRFSAAGRRSTEDYYHKYSCIPIYSSWTGAGRFGQFCAYAFIDTMIAASSVALSVFCRMKSEEERRVSSLDQLTLKALSFCALDLKNWIHGAIEAVPIAGNIISFAYLRLIRGTTKDTETPSPLPGSVETPVDVPITPDFPVLEEKPAEKKEAEEEQTSVMNPVNENKDPSRSCQLRPLIKKTETLNLSGSPAPIFTPGRNPLSISGILHEINLSKGSSVPSSPIELDVSRGSFKPPFESSTPQTTPKREGDTSWVDMADEQIPPDSELPHLKGGGKRKKLESLLSKMRNRSNSL